MSLAHAVSLGDKALSQFLLDHPKWGQMDPTCVESRFDMNNKIDIEAVAFVSDNFYEEPCV
jgi:hypothetical protein